MIVYNSMLFLVLVLMIIYKFQTSSVHAIVAKHIPWSYAIISIGYIVFWAALRSGFADTRQYIFMFEYARIGLDGIGDIFSSTEKSPGWDALQVIFKTIVSEDFHSWLAIVAIATSIPLMITLRNKSSDYLYSVFLFITSLTFLWFFNGIRQLLVCAILFGCYSFIQHKRLVPFVIVVLLCSTIHKTALIMLPSYFLVNSRPFGWRMMCYVIAVSSCAISIAPLMDTLESSLAGTAYEGNLGQFVEDDGVHPLRVAFEFIPVVLAFFKRKQIIDSHDGFIIMCVNMSVIAAGLYFVGMLTSGIMIGRLPLYFSLYNLILIPYLLRYCYNKSKITYISITGLYLAFYFTMMTSMKPYYISDILGNYI